MRSGARWQARSAVALAALAVASLLVVAAMPAGAAPSTAAQTCDLPPPYCDPQPPVVGGTQATPPPTCAVSTTAVKSGDRVVATLAGVPAGTEALLTFDGDEMGRGIAALTGILELAFLIPASTAPGTHEVRFVAPTVSCNPNSITVASVGDAVTVPGGLPRTGVELTGILLAAGMLLLTGRQLMRESRRRRRRARRREQARLNRQLLHGL